jgi:hypothetical protein
MRPFKFFQKEIKGTLDLYEGETRATASFNVDTPEGHMNRRRLYHTDRDYYDRLHNHTMYDGLTRQRIEDQERQSRIMRRLNGTEHRDLNDNPIRLFQATTVTTVNPKWWMKVKMFFQNLSLYSDQVAGIAVIATIITFIVILVISKLLNAW